MGPPEGEPRLTVKRYCIARLLAGFLIVAAISLFILAYTPWFCTPSISALASPRVGSSGEKNLCGVIALHFACLRLGLNVVEEDLEKSLPVDRDGISFGRLEQKARELGLRPRLTRLSWEQLCLLETPVILWVDNNHFLLADPRERHPKGEEMIRIYDPGDLASWFSRAQLEKRWTGECMILAGQEDPPVQGPRVRFSSLIEDCGFVEPDAETKHVYTFLNTGTAPLELNIRGLSCGCNGGEVKPEWLQPGEKGVVELAVDLSRKEGPFQAFAYLKTNDPASKMLLLYAMGGVYQYTLASVDKIFVGEMRRNEDKKVHFYMYDRRDKTLEVLEVKAAFPENPALAETFPIEVGLSRVGEKAKNLITENSRFRIRAPDYRVDLAFKPGPAASVGPFKGRIEYRTNQPGKLQQGMVPFEGVIISDVKALPSALMLSRREPSKAIRVRNTSGGAVELAGVPRIEGDIPMRIASATTDAPNEKVFEVSAQAFNSQGGLTQGEILFELKDQSIIKVPIMILGEGGGHTEVREVAGRTFLLRDGVWTDGEYDGKAETVKITYGSDAYFDLLGKGGDIGKFLALGTKVIFRFEGKWYHVVEE
jgi:hypothetical protein